MVKADAGPNESASKDAPARAAIERLASFADDMSSSELTQHACIKSWAT
jgi:hypothetical protein